MEYEIIESCIARRNHKGPCKDCMIANCKRSAPYRYRMASVYGMIPEPEIPDPPAAPAPPKSRRVEME